MGRPKGVKNGQGAAFDYRRGKFVRGIDAEWERLQFYADDHGLEFRECLRQAIGEYLEARSNHRNRGRVWSDKEQALWEFMTAGTRDAE